MGRGKWTAFIMLVAVAFVGTYFGSPYIAASRFKYAVLAADTDRLDETVDFPAVRESLKTDLAAMMMKNMSTDEALKDNPFAGLGALLAPAIIDKAVDAFVTPSGLAAVMNGEKPNTKTTGDNPLNRDVLVNYDWISLDRFRVNLRKQSNGEKGPSFLFERRGFFSWRVIRVSLPDDTFSEESSVATNKEQTGSVDEIAQSDVTDEGNAATINSPCSGYYLFAPKEGSSRSAFSLNVETNVVELVYIDFSPRELLRPDRQGDGSLVFHIDHGGQSKLRCYGSRASLLVAETEYAPKETVSLERVSGDVFEVARQRGWDIGD